MKESQYTADEIKDVMAHLYFKMKETTARQQPPDVRILKHLLVGAALQAEGSRSAVLRAGAGTCTCCCRRTHLTVLVTGAPVCAHILVQPHGRGQR